MSWSTSNAAVATVADGKVTAVGKGTATIAVTTATGKTASCTITVSAPPTESVLLDKTTLNLYPGNSAALIASLLPLHADDTLSWTSSDEAVATVQNGKVTAVFDGTAVITVTASPSGKTASCTVTVAGPAEAVTLDKTSLELYQNGTAQLIATLVPSTSTDAITWHSDNEAVATVADGKVTARGEGTANIIVTTSSGKTASCAVTVTFVEISVTLDQTQLDLHRGDLATLIPTLAPAGISDTLAWTSDNEAVATVADGKITAVGKGTATITVTTTSGLTASCTVNVTIPATGVQLAREAIILTKGDTATLVATMTPADSTDSLSWSTSDAAVVTVDNGVISAAGIGTATVTVTTSSGKTASCVVTVEIPATGVSLNKTDITMIIGETAKLTATVTPEDSTDVLVWSSSNPAIFTVVDGKVTAVSAGTATLTVTARDGVQATCIVRVKSPVPDRVTSATFNVQERYIRKIPLGTTVEQLLSGLSEKQYCKVFDASGKAADGSALAATGMVVKLLDGDTVKASYTLVVTGDADGDGQVTVNDYVAIKGHILKKSTLDGAYAQAADADGDSDITVNDYVTVKGYILKKNSITAN